jgi:ferredoxin
VQTPVDLAAFAQCAIRGDPMLRRIVEIDEAKCDGCGECVPSCAEGAIAVVGGKARLSSEALCDGFGVCLGECPRGAITIVEREAAPFDEGAVGARVAATAVHRPQGRIGLAVVADPTRSEACCSASPPSPPLHAARGEGGDRNETRSRLGNWPVQLELVPATAPFFRGADLLVAADCVPFAHARFHEDLLAGHALVIGCPKLDHSAAYVDKLGLILRSNDVRSVTVARMEVPCCGGISVAARRGLDLAGKDLPLREVVVAVDGEIRGVDGV